LGLIESTETTQNSGGEAEGKTLGWRRSAREEKLDNLTISAEVKSRETIRARQDVPMILGKTSALQR
jgi:hypothetical protein